jgi:hypothetical protein
MSKNQNYLLLIVFLVSACSSTPALDSEPLPDPIALPELNPDKLPTNSRVVDDNEYFVQQSISIDGINPVYDPEFLPALEAPLNDDELIIGVAWEEEAKAYPITVLRFREMVNDHLAGQPILVTFCPLCFTGIVHDRRIDGETVVFGNYGGLFMSAMTWYDHKTNSVWSQPWGRAIDGELKGVELVVLPSQMTTWGNWKEQHPETLAMVNDYNRLGSRKLPFWDGFVVGISLAKNDKAYYYTDIASVGLVNDTLAGFPILVWAGENTYEAYSRTVEGQDLTFILEDGSLLDIETGTTWDVTRGLAISGPLVGHALQPIPSSSSFDWAWFDFFPESELYSPTEDS